MTQGLFIQTQDYIGEMFAHQVGLQKKSPRKAFCFRDQYVRVSVWANEMRDKNATPY